MRLTQEAGRRIGEVMATVVCLLNPGVLIIGGALASSPLISGVRESLYPRSLPRGDPAPGASPRSATTTPASSG